MKQRNPPCLGVDILDTGHLEHALGRRGGDNAGTSGRRDELDVDGRALAAELGGDGVGLSELCAPVPAADGDDAELCEDNGAADGGGHLLCALDAQAEVPVKVANGDKRLEARALTGARLLLHRHDLHDLVLELGEEQVDDLVLFDGEREEVDLLDGLDLAIADELQ